MPQVTILRGGQKTQIEVPAGQTLLAAIQAAGVQISMPCGGAGRCGKCVVQAEGALSAANANEAVFLEGQPTGTRLACYAKVEGDCSAILPEAAKAVVETAYTAWGGTLAPLYASGYGVAFDIGTTTVAGQLFSPASKKPLTVLGEMNAQQPYGADVLTRITYCNDHGVSQLCESIRTQLAAMLRAMCQEAAVPVEELSYAVITGNTVMMYILCGIEPRPLAMVPFTMEYSFGGEAAFRLEGFADMPLYIPKTASAYIGADITCSVLASGMMHEAGNILLIDAGTNGEMALRTKGRLTCCSTAAGPTFEGAGIACGGNAAVGSIDTVEYVGGQFRLSTIGGLPPVKICGSGLIDAAAGLLEAGVVDAKGRMDKQYGGAFTFPGTPVYISQKDIRQLQLAKAAIRAGLDTLLHECKLSYDDLDEIILCGGFGSYLRPESAARIGLLPKDAAGKTRAIGNAAGNGAAQILQSRPQQQEALHICEQMETIELSTNRYFLDRFIQTMNFDE